MFDAGKLRSVKALDAVGQSSRAAEVGRVVGKSMSWFWHFIGMVELQLLARNSESLRELVVAMLV